MFLLSARHHLNWRKRRVDWTLAALLMVYLHGKEGQALSNQMRQTKSMSPPYAIRWWREKKSNPPILDPIEFMKKRIIWRYAKGVPTTTKSYAYLGNSFEVLGNKSYRIKDRLKGRASLLFTSPPYYGVTNYFYDQWLRLWLLGYPEHPSSNNGRNRNRFTDQESYKNLLRGIFTKTANMLTNSAVIYIRTDGRKFTYYTTVEILRETFPGKHISFHKRPLSETNQTRLFANTPSIAGEVDLIVKV